MLPHRWTEPFGREHGVFTPLARAFAARAADIGSALAAPRGLPPLPSDVSCPDAVPIPQLSELGIRANPQLINGGEVAAKGRLHAFLRGHLSTYRDDRDRMDAAGTSRLSADLEFGAISARAVWKAVGPA